MKTIAKHRCLSGIFVFLLFHLLGLNVFGLENSTCFGTTSKGGLHNGAKLPETGKNFSSYSSLGWFAGRTYLHSSVLKVVLGAYQAMELSLPDKVFVYGETGWESGGSFKPHKTHQNGLSIDLMVPVINEHGNSVELPCSPLNKFCYSIEFDGIGKFGELSIDYEALAEHIYWLHQKSVSEGIEIWRVIFDPKLQPYLYKTKKGPYLKKNIKILKKKSWVRHDEHIHVDFKVDCLPLDKMN